MPPTAKTASDAYLTYKELQRNIDIVAGNNTFSFENTGALRVPGVITKNNNLQLVSAGTTVYQGLSDQGLPVEVRNDLTAAVVADGEYGRVFIRTDNGTTLRTWQFDVNGTLTLPPIGKISNSGYEWTFGSTGSLTLPNSAVIGRASDIEITTAETNYTNSLTTWASVRASYQAQATSLGYTSTGWPFIAWNATGTTAAGFLSQLSTAMAIQ
jgi:hypothetical protein